MPEWPLSQLQNHCSEACGSDRFRINQQSPSSGCDCRIAEATPTVAGGGPNCGKAIRGDGYAEFCGAMVRLAPGRDGVVAAEIAELAGGGASGGYSRPLRTAVMTASSLVLELSLLRRLRTWLRTV